MSWLPRFFPKTIQRLMDRMNQKPLFFTEDGVEILACSQPSLHNFPHNSNLSTKCLWCGKSVGDIQSQVVVPDSIPLNINNVQQPDFNSPTSATVNVAPADKPDPLDDDGVEQKKEFLNPKNMDLVNATAYCLKCKSKNDILNPEYVDRDSRKGVRRYLTGTCAVCGSKINAIVKRG